MSNDAMERAIERLSTVLQYLRNGPPDLNAEDFREFAASRIATIVDDDVRAFAMFVQRDLGLVAIDPALIAALRTARAERVRRMATEDMGIADTARLVAAEDNAARAIADAVLAQLPSTPAPAESVVVPRALIEKLRDYVEAELADDHTSEVHREFAAMLAEIPKP